MVFADILDRVDGRRRRLVFYNVEDRDRTEPILDYVGVHDVIIEYTTDERFPTSSVAVRRGNETLAVDDIEAVSTYVTAWEAGLASDYDQPTLFACLDETIFRSSNKRQLVLASRLIETRAATLGHGRLSAGFQQLSLVEPQLAFYQQLPEPIEVSVYGEADWAPPAEATVAAYTPTGASHADYWWVIFDGSDRAGQHAALIAREESPGEYTGFWTYRQSVVAELRRVVDSLSVSRVTAD